MKPEMKRFNRKYRPVADAISRLDLDQEDREAVATAVADALADAAGAAASSSQREEFAGWNRDLFWLLAADPLVPCAGAYSEPCPWQREIKIAMHLRDAPDGRSAAWKSRPPVIRCVTCGFAGHTHPNHPDYQPQEGALT